MGDTPCFSYITLLLHTGFCQGTDPDIFKHDIEKMTSICQGNEAPLSLQLVQSSHFNCHRFYDLDRLRTTLSKDMINNGCVWKNKMPLWSGGVLNVFHQ